MAQYWLPYASMLSLAQVLCDVGHWMEEVRQDVCNVQSEVAALRQELERTRGEVAALRQELERTRGELAQLKRRVWLGELAEQEAKLVFSDAGTARRRAFELLPA